MRVVALLAAIAALCSQPAQAVTVITSVFSGTLSEEDWGASIIAPWGDVTKYRLTFSEPVRFELGYDTKSVYYLSRLGVVVDANDTSIPEYGGTYTKSVFDFEVIGYSRAYNQPGLGSFQDYLREVYVTYVGPINFVIIKENGEYGHIRPVDYTLKVTVFNGIPEPSTWAMMILGLGVIGAAMRSTRQKSLAVLRSRVPCVD